MLIYASQSMIAHKNLPGNNTSNTDINNLTIKDYSYFFSIDNIKSIIKKNKREFIKFFLVSFISYILSIIAIMGLLSLVINFILTMALQGLYMPEVDGIRSHERIKILCIHIILYLGILASSIGLNYYKVIVKRKCLHSLIDSYSMDYLNYLQYTDQSHCKQIGYQFIIEAFKKYNQNIMDIIEDVGKIGFLLILWIPLIYIINIVDIIFVYYAMTLSITADDLDPTKNSQEKIFKILTSNKNTSFNIGLIDGLWTYLNFHLGERFDDPFNTNYILNLCLRLMIGLGIFSILLSRIRDSDFLKALMINKSMSDNEALLKKQDSKYFISTGDLNLFFNFMIFAFIFISGIFINHLKLYFVDLFTTNIYSTTLDENEITNILKKAKYNNSKNPIDMVISNKDIESIEKFINGKSFSKHDRESTIKYLCHLLYSRYKDPSELMKNLKNEFLLQEGAAKANKENFNNKIKHNKDKIIEINAKINSLDNNSMSYEEKKLELQKELAKYSLPTMIVDSLFVKGINDDKNPDNKYYHEVINNFDWFIKSLKYSLSDNISLNSKEEDFIKDILNDCSQLIYKDPSNNKSELKLDSKDIIPLEVMHYKDENIKSIYENPYYSLQEKKNRIILYMCIGHYLSIYNQWKGNQANIETISNNNMLRFLKIINTDRLFNAGGTNYPPFLASPTECNIDFIRNDLIKNYLCLDDFAQLAFLKGIQSLNHQMETNIRTTFNYIKYLLSSNKIDINEAYEKISLVKTDIKNIIQNKYKESIENFDLPYYFCTSNEVFKGNNDSSIFNVFSKEIWSNGLSKYLKVYNYLTNGLLHSSDGKEFNFKICKEHLGECSRYDNHTIEDDNNIYINEDFCKHDQRTDIIPKDQSKELYCRHRDHEPVALFKIDNNITARNQSRLVPKITNKDELIRALNNWNNIMINIINDTTSITKAMQTLFKSNNIIDTYNDFLYASEELSVTRIMGSNPLHISIQLLISAIILIFNSFSQSLNTVNDTYRFLLKHSQIALLMQYFTILKIYMPVKNAIKDANDKKSIIGYVFNSRFFGYTLYSPHVSIDGDSVKLEMDENPVVVFKSIKVPILPSKNYVLTGPSGSGKSTLINLACGDIITHNKNEVFVIMEDEKNNVELVDITDLNRSYLKNSVILVPQSVPFPSHYTIYDVCMTLILPKNIDILLELIGMLELNNLLINKKTGKVDFLMTKKIPWATMSGGQKRRFIICLLLTQLILGQFKHDVNRYRNPVSLFAIDEMMGLDHNNRKIMYNILEEKLWQMIKKYRYRDIIKKINGEDGKKYLALYKSLLKRAPSTLVVSHTSEDSYADCIIRVQNNHIFLNKLNTRIDVHEANILKSIIALQNKLKQQKQQPKKS